jgi:hypothetical protein
MSEQAEQPAPEEVVVVPSVTVQNGNKANKGVIILSITLIITCMIIIYFVFFDKKVARSSSRMNNGSAMPFISNRGLNSFNISSNGGYGYKAN